MSDLFERCLSLTASFEGHNYTLAKGNMPADPVGITWGIIGFTLLNRTKSTQGISYSYGSLKLLLDGIDSLKADADGLKPFDRAFKSGRAKELRDALKKKAVDLLQWADGVSNPQNGKKTLLPAWQEEFGILGKDEEVRALQREHAKTRYFDRAKEAAGNLFAFRSDRGVALLFDILVQNGRPSQERIDEYRQRILESDSERTKREALAIVIATTSKVLYIDDVLSRKMTVACGQGVVHSSSYDLDQMELPGDDKPEEATNPRLLTMCCLSEERGFQEVVRNKETATEEGFLSSVDGKVDKSLLGDKLSGGIEKEQFGSGAEYSLNHLHSGFWKRVAEDATVYREFLFWNLRLFTTPVTCWVIGGNHGSAKNWPALCWGDPPAGRSPVAGGFGLKRVPGGRLSLSWFGANGQEKREVPLHFAHSAFRECCLVILLGSYGIPTQTTAAPRKNTPEVGHAWQDYVESIAKRKPVVLGWQGPQRLPTAWNGLSLTELFWTYLKGLWKERYNPDPGTPPSLQTMCDTDDSEIIQAWGRACYACVPLKTVRYSPWILVGAPLAASLEQYGAAALDRDGAVWQANPLYHPDGEGLPAQRPMVRSGGQQ